MASSWWGPRSRETSVRPTYQHFAPQSLPPLPTPLCALARYIAVYYVFDLLFKTRSSGARHAPVRQCAAPNLPTGAVGHRC